MVSGHYVEDGSVCKWKRKDQSSANIVKQQLSKLSLKVGTAIQPVFLSRKLNEDLKMQEAKPSIVNQQCVVYEFKCNLCDAGYVGYTRGHLHERVEGHKRKSSSIYGFTFLRNAPANLIASFMRCYSYAN